MLKCSIPILMYHLVTPRTEAIPRKYRVTPRMFARQMRWLALAGYTPVTLEALYVARTGQIALPLRPVIITFDDGFYDSYIYAVPLLLAQHFTAAFFLVTGLMGRTAEWLSAHWKVQLPMIDWPQAQQLAAVGFQCGSHTVNHPRLVELDDAARRRELHDSRVMLEDRLELPVRHLAYPFGSFDARIRDLVAACGYATACSTVIGLSTPADDGLALRRVPINGQDTLLDFVWRLRLGHNVHETFQRVAWRVRRYRHS